MNFIPALRAIFVAVALAAILISGISRRALAQAPPPGPYQHDQQPLHFGEGCINPVMVGTSLIAECFNVPLQKWGNSRLDAANACVAAGHQIDNINGMLRCVISPGVTAGGEDGNANHRYVGNIVSMLPTVTTSEGTNKYFIIDNPRVDVVSSNFTNITYAPGDTIQLWANGCVQTGGTGLTWKSYTVPLGKESGQLYSGTVLLPGVTRTNNYGLPTAKIDGFISNDINHQQVRLYPLSLSQPQTVLKAGLFLRLGYFDDNYSDNGYYQHDDGNYNQCKGVGPAWVMIRILHPLAGAPPPTGVSWFPGPEPFDLTWNQNVPADANGVPINPVWRIQVSSPSPSAKPSPQAPCGWTNCGTPDFYGICGKAFPNGRTIDEAYLANHCTTDAPEPDIDTGAGLGIGGYCTDHGPFNGHINWWLATYEGQLAWEAYSGPPPADSDFTFRLKRNDEALATLGGSPGVTIEDKSTTSFAEFEGTNWWRQFYHDSDSGKHQDVDGAFTVVTGQVGIDAVHFPGQVEIHPIFAMAIRTADLHVSGGEIATWQYFILNQGDEGNCSEYMYQWGPTGAVQIPWPVGATHAQILQNPLELWADQNGGTMFPPPTYTNSAPWTTVNFQIPPSTKIAGADGQVTIEFTIPGAKPEKHTPTRSASVSKGAAEYPDSYWPKIAASIRDPKTRSRFSADISRIMYETPPPASRTTIASETLKINEDPTSNLSRRAVPVKAQRFLDPIRVRQDAQIRALFVKYHDAFPDALPTPR